MRRALVLWLTVAVGAVACETEAVSETVAPTVQQTTTPSTLPATTTGVPATTAEATTSTSSSTTTSSTVAVTTTVGGLEGNWAPEPLVVTGFGALGWWDGSEWVIAEEEGALPVVGGEDYQVASVDLYAVTTGGPQTLVCDPVDVIGVVLDDPELLGAWPGPYGVALSAPWDLQPHLFEAFEDNGTYASFAAELLAARGLEVAEPVIKQLFRTDLEGDGVNEVLVVAEDVTPSLIMEEGDYSIVFLRKVVAGEVQTAVLGETIVQAGDSQFGASYSVGAVADLSGDSKMEIVVDSAFFEGLTVEVFEYVDDDLGAVSQLTVWCGV